MSRAVWKVPFVDPSLMKKVDKLISKANSTPIKTWSRKSTVIPEFVGFSFLIHNGKKFIPIKISEEMVGHKLGEFSPTRQFSGHTPADKKAAQEAAAEISSKTPIDKTTTSKTSKITSTYTKKETQTKELYSNGIVSRKGNEKNKQSRRNERRTN